MSPICRGISLMSIAETREWPLSTDNFSWHSHQQWSRSRQGEKTVEHNRFFPLRLLKLLVIQNTSEHLVNVNLRHFLWVKTWMILARITKTYIYSQISLQENLWNFPRKNQSEQLFNIKMAVEEVSKYIIKINSKCLHSCVVTQKFWRN